MIWIHKTDFNDSKVGHRKTLCFHMEKILKHEHGWHGYATSTLHWIDMQMQQIFLKKTRILIFDGYCNKIVIHRHKQTWTRS